ncbi:hypothetical protein GUITHDRAFT_161182, partial [Guillardia theta CCMP2712]
MADRRLKGNEVVLEGYVYDLDAFSKVHPGGADALRVFGGSDATTHYYMLHPHKEIRVKALEPFRLRKAEAPVHDLCCERVMPDTIEQKGSGSAHGDLVFKLNTPAFQDLKSRVQKAIPYQFATSEWYVKACLIMILNVSMEYLIVRDGPSLLKASVLGLSMALIGLCIQHDANHGAVSKSGWVNRFWGYTQDWIGGSSLLWRHHHVLMHHADTNVNGDDPDITGDLIRFNKLTNWKGHHKWQALYTWFLLPLLPFRWHFSEIFDLINMKHLDRSISPMAQTDARIALFLRQMPFFFMLRFYALPLYFYPSFFTLFCHFVCLAVGGSYLGFNFVISHNFEGARSVLDSTDRSKHEKRDWSFDQVETSSTVGGRVLGYLHGGLNYQIEHHLFPRISHVHYHKLAPVVRQWCLDHGLKYTYYPTVFHNVLSTYRYLNA